MSRMQPFLKAYSHILDFALRGEAEPANMLSQPSVQLMENLDWPNAIKEIVTAERFLRHEGSPKVATVGFCMGKHAVPGRSA